MKLKFFGWIILAVIIGAIASRAIVGNLFPVKIRPYLS